ncbi:MAG TPA: tripartite tricarboxylate transporter substrate binding protein, partial [Caldimonas sp.]
MQRRSVLKAAAGAAATLGVPRLHAQAWPTGPVRIVVGFPPGGGTDALARVVGQKLGMMWNQQVIIENKAGVAGVLAADYVAQQP